MDNHGQTWINRPKKTSTSSVVRPIHGESPRDQIFGPPQGAGPETTTGHPAARAGELSQNELVITSPVIYHV